MMSIFDGSGNRLAGPNFVPLLQIKIDYEWGEPAQQGKTVKNFMISADEGVHTWRDERLGIPIALGASPVTPLKAIEVASPEIS